jgi:DNA topoisomerase-1
MLYRRGRYGPFLGCSDYPSCKGILKLDKEGGIQPAKATPQSTKIKCYKCKDGELVIRQSKRGPFLGCNRFPKCRTIISYNQLDKLKQLQSQGKWPPETAEQAHQILDRKKTKRAKKASRTQK